MSKFTKLFFDTEFTGLHQNTTLISIGIVSECGKTFYAEFNDFDKSQVDDWITEHVINNLLFSAPREGEDEYYAATRSQDNHVTNDLYKGYSVKLRGNKNAVATELKRWLTQFDQAEMWSDCLAYDWVLFNDLIADYTDGYPKLPANIYYIPFDISTLFRCNRIDPDISREYFADMQSDSTKHNALWDAMVIKACFDKLYFAMPSDKEFEDALDKAAFRVPYNGSNQFYDEKTCTNWKECWQWVKSKSKSL